MALTNEDLMAIATLLQPINERLDKVDSRLDKVDERLDNLDSRLDNLERQIKRTERTLKAEIIDLILDEVSRVHRILNEHAKDKTKHIA